MATQDLKRRLTAILSAHVKDYSRLMGEDEEATVSIITAHREVMSAVIQKHRGGWWTRQGITYWLSLPV